MALQKYGDADFGGTAAVRARWLWGRKGGFDGHAHSLTPEQREKRHPISFLVVFA